jgi:hypothetical protein
MSSIVTSHPQASDLPRGIGYTHGFAMLTVVSVAAAAAALLVPSTRRTTIEPPDDIELLPHAELGLLAAGTLSGDEPE